MIDYNHSASTSEHITQLMDEGLKRRQAAMTPRSYLGASRLGVSCSRALQFEYAQAPVDPGREHRSDLLRIFQRGHIMEDCMVDWLRDAGFDLRTRKADGEQFGFTALNGQLQGHIDGVLVAGPDDFRYPALWENKCVGAKSWRALAKDGVAVAKPVYAGQMAIYQAYLELHEHPALFTALNADTMAIHAEWVPFDAALAQRLSDRGLQVVSATQAGELLPRAFVDSTHFECSYCQWQERCWRS